MENGVSDSSENPKTTGIEHIDDVLDMLQQLLMSESYADVIFIVQDERIPAHRAILAARSEYFRVLLYGNLAEAQQREINQDLKLEPFKQILQYMYTGSLSIATAVEDIGNTLEILELARFLMLPKLVAAITIEVERDLTLSNVSAVLNFTAPLQFDVLSNICLALIDSRASDFIQHESFKTLSKVALEKILQRDCFPAPEIGIFLAAMDWYNENPSTENKSVFSHIRLATMDIGEIVNDVKPTKIFNDDEILAAIVRHTQEKKLPYRYYKGKNKHISFVSRSTIHTDDGDTYTLAELASNSLINHIHATFSEQGVCYTVKVSENGNDWYKVINYKKYACDSSQDIYFKARRVRYIKFGWEDDECDVLETKMSYASFSCMMPQVVKGVVAPSENVVSDTKAKCLEGTFDNGLIRFPMKSNPTIKFNQPYHIGSLRFSFKDRPNVTVSIYTATDSLAASVDTVFWKEVFTGQASEQFNHITFEPHTVLYVKIKVQFQGYVMPPTMALEMPSQDPEFIAKQIENRHTALEKLKEKQKD